MFGSSSRRHFLFAAVVAATICGCGDGDGDDPGPTPTPIVILGRDCPPDNIITYENFAQGFMSTWCTSCHSSALGAGERAGAPIGVDLDTYDLVREQAVRAFARAADVQAEPTWMPPAGGPTEEDRFLVGDWIACNAPREADL